jgi:hypothetical protein
VHLCGIDDPHFSLEPTFFGGDFYAGSFTIRLQHGGDNAEFSDELTFQVDDTEYVARNLDRRLPVGGAGVAPVHAVLGLTRSCGRRGTTQRGQNVALEAFSGYIVFHSIYRGSSIATPEARNTEVTEFSIALRDPRPVRDFVDSATPEPQDRTSSTGELEGRFQFYFTRGRPAQRFP